MNSTNNEELSSDLENYRPRRYQEEVFTQAQQENIIAALDTGSGKTYISNLLIRWISVQERYAGKPIIFMAPKVALVEQQSAFLAKHSCLKVLKLHGDHDWTDREEWARRFEQYHIFVMTPMIFVHILTHSLWSIDRVALLVFDECHHTQKRHPYNTIMKEYKRVQPSRRPKIFGMTASPIWDPKKPNESLKELEMNMDSVIVGVFHNVEELAEHSPKPTEVIVTYSPIDEDAEDKFQHPSLFAATSLFASALISDPEILWGEIVRRYEVTLGNLGPFAASLYLYHQARAALDRILERKMLVDSKGIDDTLHLDDILGDYEHFFSLDSELDVLLDHCAPKIKVLVDLLAERINDTFRGIIFVEQRQFATTLSYILPRIPELRDKVRCEYILGSASSGGAVKELSSVSQQRALAMFREGGLNLLVATSVAEEGLDFPACDVVIRFDPLQHLVGYVQSRGRARNKISTFIAMIQIHDFVSLEKYKQYFAAEPQLKVMYQTRAGADRASATQTEEEDDDMVDVGDAADRERYVVPSTNAFVNYDNAIELINHLCSMIPCDQYMSPQVAKYSGDFQSRLRLPSSLPVSPTDLTFVGPLKSSKKEAKRAVAFIAVKRLHELDIFDDYLLPAGAGKRGHTDGDGRTLQVKQVTSVPTMLDVFVRDPWYIGPTLYIHTLWVGRRRVAGLVTGTRLGPCRMTHGGLSISVSPAEELFQADIESRQIMADFTEKMILLMNTGRPLEGEPSVYLVPLLGRQPDFSAMLRLVRRPFGNRDWSNIDSSHHGRLIVMDINQYGRPFLLQRIRHDLTPMSIPGQGTPQAEYPTYHDFLTTRRKSKNWAAVVPKDGPLIEVTRLPRCRSSAYSLTSSSPASTSHPETILAEGSCKWYDVSMDVADAYLFLPALCHYLTDLHRVRQLKFEIGLPSIHENLLIQALTIPSASAGYNNQRLETLGDAVLELGTTVHLFNKFPHRHEGQLDNLRQASVSNKCLLSRALDIKLEEFITAEVQSVKDWRWVVSRASGLVDARIRSVPRRIPRRSLQDCMEATLGAAFLTGGIDTALVAGAALGVTFGGPCPWRDRYHRLVPTTRPMSPLFIELQAILGYTFLNQDLLVEAVTHPSAAIGNSYQRLEYLGDAVLNLAVMHNVYERFPDANSERLTQARSKCVCAPALAFVAVKRFNLHKVLLMNSVDLGIAISHAVDEVESFTAKDIVHAGWSWDPPKALSDVLESVIGAVFVDLGFDYGRIARIVECAMDDILKEVSPRLPKDPLSELQERKSAAGCRAKLQCPPCASAGRGFEAKMVLHGVTICDSIFAPSAKVARFKAAKYALQVLMDPRHEMSLARVCNCSELEDMKKNGMVVST